MIDHSYSKYSSLYVSGGSREGARGRGGGPPLFLDQTEAQRAEKNLFGDSLPPYLRVWMIGPPGLSEGLDPPLYEVLRLNRCLSQAA